MHTAKTRTAAKTVVLLITLLLPAMAQEQSHTFENADAEKSVLQARLKALQIQKQIDLLIAQRQAIEKYVKAMATSTTTEIEIEVTQARMKMLALQDRIDVLKTQQSALLNPPALPSTVSAALAPPTTEAKPLSPEDAEIQRLKEEHQRLIKQAEIDRLTKENAALQPAAPPTPPVQSAPIPAAAPIAQQSKPNCPPQQGTNVTFKTPKKAASWVCQHTGVCVDDKPAAANNNNACPPDTSASGQAAQQ